MSERIFFDGWPPLLRTAIVGVLAYAALVAILRSSGKRTLSKMNAFDFVVTVALGSTLATILLSRDVALAEGVLAFGLLAALQFIVAWLSVRFAWARNLFKSEPQLLLYRGTLLPSAMRNERVAEDEIRSVVRAEGWSDLEEIEALVLETDGTFSVIPRTHAAGASALAGLDLPSSEQARE